MTRIKRNRLEDLHQTAYFEWLQFYYPTTYGLTIYVPNDGKRNQMLGKIKGIKPGVPDIFMFYPTVVDDRQYHGLAIELKRPIVKGERKPIVSLAQKKMIKVLTEQNYKAEVCFGWDEAAELTLWYLGKRSMK